MAGDGNITPIDNTLGNILLAITNATNAINARTSQTEYNVNSNVSARAQGILNNLGLARDTIINSVNSASQIAQQRIQATEINLRSNAATIQAQQQNALSNATSTILNTVNATATSMSTSNRNLLQNVQDTINHNLFELTGGLQSSIINAVNGVQSNIDGIQGQLQGFVDGIGNAVRDLLNDIAEAIRSIFEPFQDFIDERFQDLSNWLTMERGSLQHQIETLLANYGGIVEKVIKGDYKSFEAFWSDLKATNIDLGAFSDFGKLITILMLIPQITNAPLAAFRTRLEQLTNEQYPTTLLDAPTVIKMLYLGMGNPALLKDELEKQGLHPAKIDLLIEASRPMLAVGELQQAYLRGNISEDTHDTKLRQLGFRDNDISILKGIYFVVPPIQDIIRMAVREVFSPAIAQTYGLFEDYPSAVEPYAQQQGLNPEWTKRYWAAHWELPSPQMGFQMFHRGIINQEQMTLLLRALDIMPYWREKLIQMNYTLLTRVDVRRMHKEGVLTADEIYQEYLKQGHSPQDARRLADFTIRYNDPEDAPADNDLKQLTRSVIERGFIRGVLTRDDALARLKEIGYPTNDANLLLDIALYDYQTKGSVDRTSDVLKRVANTALDGYRRRSLSRLEALELLQEAGYTIPECETLLDIGDVEYQVSLKKEFSEIVKQLYIERTIDSTEAFGLLTANAFSSEEATHLIESLTALRSLGTRKLSLAELRKALKGQLITEDEYYDELLGLGYNERYAKILLQMN